MTAQELLNQTRDVMTVKRVFGEPYERDGVTMIPVARIAGGAGGGEGPGQAQQTNVGGGFGLRAVPAGMYVIKDGSVAWRPALDINRIIAGGQLVAALVLLTVRTIVKERSRASAPIASRLSLPRKSRLFWRWPAKHH